MASPRKPVIQFETLEKDDATFHRAAEIFRVMSAPMRLRIMSCLCAGEKNVSELLEEVETTQSNMSQHLSTLYRAGIVHKRREGVQIYYVISNPSFVDLCKAVCSQIASESLASD
jgi:ArsR family transcriptional regulator